MGRKQNARRDILQAARELFSEKCVSDVGVKEIVLTAGVSRKSFYVYFTDKYNVMTEIYKEDSEKLLGDSWGDPFSVTMEKLYGIYTEKPELYRNLFAYTGQNSVADYAMQEGMSWHIAHVLSHSGRSTLSQDEMYDIHYHVKSMAFLTNQFLSDYRGSQHSTNVFKPEKKMADYVINTLPPVLKAVYS